MYMIICCMFRPADGARQLALSRRGGVQARGLRLAVSDVLDDVDAGEFGELAADDTLRLARASPRLGGVMVRATAPDPGAEIRDQEVKEESPVSLE